MTYHDLLTAEQVPFSAGDEGALTPYYPVALAVAMDAMATVELQMRREGPRRLAGSGDGPRRASRAAVQGRNPARSSHRSRDA